MVNRKDAENAKKKRQEKYPFSFSFPSLRSLRLGGFVPALLVVAIVSGVMLAGAYQARPVVRIPVGDAAVDTALVRNFNAPERQAAADGGRRFRWTRGEGTLDLPGIGRGAYDVRLVLAAANNPQPDIRILANGVQVGAFQATPDFRPYDVHIPAAVMTHGSLALTVAATPFQPRGDKRTLGAVVEDVTVQPVGDGLALPPARIALSLWVGAMCVALALAVAGVGGIGVVVGGACAAGGMAAFLVGNRLFLTVDTGGVVRAGVLMIAACAAVRFGLPPSCRRWGLVVTARDVRWLAAIVGAALALRFAGVLHPGITIVDLRFHLNRLSDVVDRHQLLLPIQSAEVGGRTVLYAPTPYLILWPFAALVRDRVLLLFLFALATDGVRFCVIWLVTRAATRDGRTADLAVLTMALMPVGWIVYSWGVFANIFAEGMLTLLFALLVLGYDKLAGPRRWAWFAAFAVVICLTLLAHIGVFVLTAATVGLYGLARAMYLVSRPAKNLTPGPSPSAWRGEQLRALTMFVGAATLAAVVAFAVFWRFPAHDLLVGKTVTAIESDATVTAPAPAQKRYRTGGATPDDRIGLPAVGTNNLAVAVGRETWEMSYAFYGVWPVLAALVGIGRRTQDAGLSGAWRARRGMSNEQRAIREEDDSVLRPSSFVLTLAVWLGVAAILLVVGLMARLYVRYPLYALPAVAVGAAVTLRWLTTRGRWGDIAVAALLALSALGTLLMWYDRIVYAFKAAV